MRKFLVFSVLVLLPSISPTSCIAADLAAVLTQVDLAALPVLTNDLSGRPIRYVSTGGSDTSDGISRARAFRTIQHALDVAPNKAVISIGGGQYLTQQLQITKSNVALVARAGQQVVLLPANPQSDDWNDASGIQLYGPIKNVIIDGLSLRGFRRAGIVYGAGSAPQRNIQIRRTTINGAAEAIVNDYPQHSGYLVNGLRIDSVTIAGASLIGITCGDEVNPCAKNVRISNVTLTGTNVDGEDSGADGIAFVQSDNILIVKTNVRQVSADGMDFKATRVSVVNSRIENVGRNGLKFWHGGEAINTLVDNTGADAAVVMEDGDNRLINCVVSRHLFRTGGESYAMTVGYDLTAPSGSLEIVNTIFAKHPGPIWVNSALPLEIRNSIFSRFINGNIFLDYNGVTYSSATAVNSSGFASGVRTARPRFVDPAAGNFRLSAGSPGIDTGTAIGAVPNFDIRRAPRPQGSGIDIGIYER